MRDNLDWSRIDTVLLDMDGTLLDLHFDDYFWRHHVPERRAARESMPVDAVREDLFRRYKEIEGTLDWYCVDHWSRELDLDIAALKREISHLIRVHPGVETFLAALHQGPQRVLLVTNAHLKSLELKLEKTELARFFDAVVSSHSLGVPKESPDFWPRLQALEPFDPARTLFVDDSLPVLESARDYGIAHLLTIRRPSSTGGARESAEFPLLDSFADIVPVG